MPASRLFPFVTPRMDAKPMRPDRQTESKQTIVNQNTQRADILSRRAPQPARPSGAPTQAQVRQTFADRHPHAVVRPEPLPSTKRLNAMLGAATQIVEGQTRDKAGYGMRNREIRRELARRQGDGVNRADGLAAAKS